MVQPIRKIFGSDIESYTHDFTAKDPDLCFIQFLKDLSFKEKLTVIDLMADPSAVRSLALRYRQSNTYMDFRGISVDLNDVRSAEQIAIDRELGITQVNRDLTPGHGGWSHLRRLLNGEERNADLILARPFGGLYGFPHSCKSYFHIIGNVWNLLEEEGKAYLQLPNSDKLRKFGVNIKLWTEILEENGIEYSYQPEYISQDGRRKYGWISITKNSDRNLPTGNQIRAKSPI